jgi:cation diffusion facilitator family transporter
VTKETRKEILRAVKLGLIINLFLAILKLSFGFWGHAAALVSDGLNSSSDVFISLMILVVLQLATKKPDYDHPYGHEKYEGLAYFVLGIIFMVTAGYIMVDSILLIIGHITHPGINEAPHLLTVFVSIAALLIKLGLYRYYIKIGKRYQSPTIKADAKNHLIDVYATSFSVIGLAITQFGYVMFDDIAAFIIGLFIMRLAIQIIGESASFLTDQAPSKEEIKAIYSVILSIEGVLKVDDLKVRKHMTQRYVDVEIAVRSSHTLEHAHKIAETVHHHVEDVFPDVIHCMVHVNPERNL